ncbi:tRNA methyltransferase 10 homolog C-like [Gigantopelta aegis]|uniref:tRNA methyltransferase 10 homolog C-like n=1 Tax=Gigantopelta aegis TaxID=1735272 RepID=UPI001B88846B|nr:tRNA methyltransferase 10 homolog C-like [Gigantopelta aegis]XP_041347819.1 tRNA methyltransferase 10 homolog C-like [Gigantopelta aegis]XP_041347821.1 tRNA methyltransferase 10 homolog C-like [Gigantopelta aegis]
MMLRVLPRKLFHWSVLDEISLVTTATKCYPCVTSIECSYKHLSTKSSCLPKLLYLSNRNCSQHAATRLEGEKHTGMEIKSASEILSSLDAETEKKLKVFKMEYEVLLHMGAFVPETMTDDTWLRVLEQNSSSARRRLYRFLRRNEKLEEKKKAKQRAREEERLATESQTKDREESPPLEPKNTFFFHIRQTSMNRTYYTRLAHSMLFGIPLVFDLDFEQHMRTQDCQNLVSQFMMAYGFNKVVQEPFHFVLTGANPQGHIMRMLNKGSVERPLDSFLFTVTEQSYLDLYPRNNVVYLTPNAPNVLKSFNPNDVYIIGGLVDKTSKKPFTMAKAKEQNIRMAKFPLDEHLIWSQGTKSLTIDQVVRILLELKESNSWKRALQYVPKRKIARDYLQ